jgi:integrase
MPRSRSATLRVAHQRDCRNASRTSLDSLEGCTCKRSYYTFHRDGARTVKGPRVRDRQVAERALRKLLVAIDEGRAGVGLPARRSRTFDQWAEEYLENLERDKRNKGSTSRAYRSTLYYARPIIGKLELDQIGLPELRQVVRKIRERGGSDATMHKHLRHLRALLTAAVEEGYATSNALSRKFIESLDLKIPKHVEPYTDVELGKLWAAMGKLGYEEVYVVVARAAVASGARLGELIALDWDDLRLSERELHIGWHYDPLDGKVLPKDGEARTVVLLDGSWAEAAQRERPDLAAGAAMIDALRLFERWTARSGVQPGDSAIFKPPRSASGRLNSRYVSKLMVTARREAGISDAGERGGKRKPFHAFRASYTRILRENGVPEELVQHNLGHSTPVLTREVYGRWSREALHAASRRAVVAA